MMPSPLSSHSASQPLSSLASQLSSHSASIHSPDPLFVFITYGGSTANAARWFYSHVPHLVIRAPFPPSRTPSPHDPTAPAVYRTEPHSLPVTLSVNSAEPEVSIDLAGAVRYIRSASVGRPVVLVYPSYGAKPPFVARFLLRTPGLISAVAISGNRTFGRGFCASAKRILSMPVLHTFEVSGTHADAERIISAARLLVSDP